MKNKELSLIHASELSLTEENSLNAYQLKFILKKTPPQHVKQRPAKGGGVWDYVSGGYIKKCLNLMFGFEWDFEILDEKIIHGEAIVKGKLTCRSNGKTIVKMQYGNKDIIYKTEKVFNEDGKPKMIIKYGKEVQETRPTENPLSIGNDLKSAATDCLKKCASEIGIAADIYNKEDFREIKVATEKDTDSIYNEIVALSKEKKDLIPEHEMENLQRIIDNKEVLSYNKALKTLRTL